MATLRKTTQDEKEIFEYLNSLRESGQTNMFGAAPYVADAFDMPIKDARLYLSTWMKVFNKEGKYDEIELE